MTYTHLNQTERYQIYVLMKAGQTQPEMARAHGRRGYRSRQAQILSYKRSQSSRSAAHIDEQILFQVRSLLTLQWSHEQIASQLPISHDDLPKDLRRQSDGRTFMTLPALAETKTHAISAAVIDAVKFLTGALLLIDLNRLSVAPKLVTGKPTRLLELPISTQSLLWSKEKAARQW